MNRSVEEGWQERLLSAVPTMKEASFARGGDLQTLTNLMKTASLSLWPQETLFFKDDKTGDRLQGTLHFPLHDKKEILVILIHGLAGDEDSSYIKGTARFLLERGYPVYRFNLRGAGLSGKTCTRTYHAGRTEDLSLVFSKLKERFPTQKFCAVGFSIGGAQLLKYLGEGGDFLDGGMSVSAPIDLLETAEQFSLPRNRLYQDRIMKSLKKLAIRPQAPYTEEEKERIQKLEKISHFDEQFTAPSLGYETAVEYYKQNSARQFMAQIKTPTVIIHADNDPWIPMTSYATFPWQETPNVLPFLTEGGGHVGFIMKKGGNWYNAALKLFLKEIENFTVKNS